MRRLSTISFAAAVIALFSLSAAQAAVVSLAGDFFPPTSGMGQLQILIDIAPENNTFTNGGLSLAVTSSNPGVIEFTDAAVENQVFFGGSIWSIDSVTGLTADGIEDLFAASVSTQALNPALPGNPIVDGGTQFLFATIDYNVVGEGVTDVNVAISGRVDPVFSSGVDVSSTLSFVGAIVDTRTVPEPTTMMLAGLGLIGFVGLRRRS